MNRSGWQDIPRLFSYVLQQKIPNIHDELQWWDEWPQSLVEGLLEAMKHVRRAHKLALSSEPPTATFCVKTRPLVIPSLWRHTGAHSL